MVLGSDCFFFSVYGGREWHPPYLSWSVISNIRQLAIKCFIQLHFQRGFYVTCWITMWWQSYKEDTYTYTGCGCHIYWLWLSHRFCVNVSNTELAKNMTRPVIYGILTCIIMKLLIVFWSRKMSGSEKTDDYIIGLFIPQCIPPWYFVLFIVFWWLLTGCESRSGVLLFYNAEVFLLLLTGWYATTTRMDHCTTF